MTQVMQVFWYGLVDGSSYLLFGIGLALSFGIMKIMNMAHGEFFMLGAMGAWTLTYFLGLNIFWATLFTIAGVAALSLVVNRLIIKPVFHVSSLAPLLSTLGLSLIILYSGYAGWGANAKVIKSPFTEKLSLGGLVFSGESLAVVVTSIIAILGLYLLLKKTNIGRQIQATIQNEVGAKLIGINTTLIYDLAMLIAAVLAALGGVLMGMLHTASVEMGQQMLITGFVIVIVAGMGNLVGVAIVAVMLGILQSFLANYFLPQYTSAIIYVILIMVLVFKPKGLFAKTAGR